MLRAVWTYELIRRISTMRRAATSLVIQSYLSLFSGLTMAAVLAAGCGDDAVPPGVDGRAPDAAPAADAARPLDSAADRAAPAPDAGEDGGVPIGATPDAADAAATVDSAAPDAAAPDAQLADATVEPDAGVDTAPDS